MSPLETVYLLILVIYWLFTETDDAIIGQVLTWLMSFLTSTWCRGNTLAPRDDPEVPSLHSGKNNTLDFSN